MKPLVDFIVYDLKVYRLFPWEYGGRYIFQWPTWVWIKKEWAERGVKWTCRKGRE